MKIIKTNLLILTILSIGLSCQKNRNLVSEVDRVVPYSNAPSHCYDGYWDEDLGEVFIDCGGTCPSCSAATPSCLVANNTFVIGSTTKIPNSGTTSIIQTTTTPKFRMTGTIVGGGTYEIIFGSDEPFDYTYYTISSNTQNNLEEDEVKVTVTPSGMNLNSCIDGTVYFSKIGTTYYATICDATAWSTGWTPQGYSVTGNVNCQ